MCIRPNPPPGACAHSQQLCTPCLVFCCCSPGYGSSMIRIAPSRPRFYLALLTLLLGWFAASLRAQDNSGSPAHSLSGAVTRTDAVDKQSGVHYVRLILASADKDETDKTALPPHLVFDCFDDKGKHTLAWTVSFGGIDIQPFDPPFHSTQSNLFPPQYPYVDLRMSFEGYIRSKPMVRAWQQLPSGELRYHGPGSASPNMETVRFFLDYLNALPGLRIAYAKKSKSPASEVFFGTAPLLKELNA